MAVKGESALKKAIKLEKDGIDFYLKSAEKAKNVLVKKIFEGLVKEEEYHIKMINQIYERLKNNETIKEWVTGSGFTGNLEKVFQDALVEKARKSKNDIEALKLALEMEDKSIKYYEKLAAKTDDYFEKRFYLTLSYEERGHYLRIMDSIEYISDPAGWYFIKQGSMVDGG
ncbi:MAG TPA: ferritin family protein [Syntrophorhabdaceae bacterium]|nr:ferritin family protein [Syntrophorhabdaceae bacterium]HOL04697.1 ferritin family protein [Syntrophorhabdaceae bacterium]HON85250.1 ferritin family protein [Syntrophorhabdaceae bacterium]HOT42736.1 ferritin family protein [Syntrophorhabdaceae bacterium]HPC66131.1 ferritin family protein [Syntrophorhabdaceae bacterium]